jgi:hypothetical protein
MVNDIGVGGDSGSPNKNDVFLRNLEGLVTYPKEDIATELKSWLSLEADATTLKEDAGEARADLAQAIIAIANTGGGHVVLGFNDDGTPSEPRPATLDSYDQDAVNGIVKRYADPSFHCDVFFVKHPLKGLEYPVVVVPGNHRVPIRVKSDSPKQKHLKVNTYLIRCPGPESRPVGSAGEWEELIGRCVRASRDRLLDDIRSVIYGVSLTPVASPEEEAEKERQAKISAFNKFGDKAIERWKDLVANDLTSDRDRYQYGVWTVAYSVLGDFDSPTATGLLEILSKIEGQETGWPAWAVMTRRDLAPRSYNGLVEGWLARDDLSDAYFSDFWWASREGMLFLLRGYREDTRPDLFEPGTFIDPASPIWQIGECLLHAQRFSEAVSANPADILFRAGWDGLQGRVLRSIDNQMFNRYRNSDRRECHQPTVHSEVVVSAEQIRDGLPEVVREITRPLYESFGFYEPSPEFILREIRKMTGSA